MSDIEELRQEQKNLLLSLQQFSQGLQALKKMQEEQGKALNQTRNVLNKLAALQDLEFIEELNDLVSKKKWAELKKNPRE